MTASKNRVRVSLLVVLIAVAGMIHPRAARAQSEDLQNTQAELTNMVYMPAVSYQDPSLLGKTYPGYTNSFYITNTSNTNMFNLGCEIGTRDLNLPGTQDSLTVLSLGQPWTEGGVDGILIMTRTWAAPVPYNQIVTAIQQFMSGYWVCSSSDQTSKVTVAVGVNNYGSYGYSGYSESVRASSAYNHGGLMAQTINSISQWLVTSGFGRQISVVAGLDAEFAWNTPRITRAYIDGFINHNSGGYKIYNYGSCDACPYTTPFETFSYNGWMPDDAWYVTYGASVVWSLPEIYLETGKNAAQWKNLSLYAYQYKGSKITFIGSLTQYQACLQNPGEAACQIADNTPQAGWTQLHTQLNGDWRTSQPALPYASDILWTSKPRP